MLLSVSLVPIAAAGIIPLSGSIKNTQKPENKIKPNLIFVYADQWRRMAMSYYSDPRFDNTYNQGDPVHTPNIDRCAQEGMIFHNAVATSPICSPNRATLLTGLYPSSHGLIQNSNYTIFSHDYETIAHVLKSNGYETAHIGKWHLSMTKPEKFFETDSTKRGFDYWYGSPNHNHNNFDAQLYHTENEIDGLGEYTINGKVLPNPFIPSMDYSDIELRKQESWNPDHLTRKALDYLKNSFGVRDVMKPFALYISYNPPHTIHGNKPNDGNEGSWHIAGIKEGESYYGWRDAGPPDYDYRAPVKYEAEYRQGNSYSDPVRTDLRSRPNVPKDHYSKFKCLPGYFGAVNSIDECFGLLDEYLSSTPDPRYPDMMLKETSIVVITADHGEMMGSNNKMTKGIPLEESIAVPFIIRWPQHIPAGSEEEMVYNSVDVAPSLLGLLGFKLSGSIDGTDRSEVFLGNEKNKCQYAFLSLRNWRAVRSENEIYIVEFFPNRKDISYYNLEKDPFQLHPLKINPKNKNVLNNKQLSPNISILHKELKNHLEKINDPDYQLDKYKLYIE